jgi:tetratricopeptide (TPR) repeat protein
MDIFRKPRFQLLLIIVLGILVYSNTFDVPFQFDDMEYIIDHPAVRDFKYFLDPSRIVNLDISPDMKRCLSARYVAYLSFWVNYRFGGLDVTGYHALNLAIHIINALLVYYIVTLTFMTPSLRGSSLKVHPEFVALFSGLLFVAHPVQTMAVTYILQRWASLVALFYLSSIILYVKWRIGTMEGSRHDKGTFAHRISCISYLLSLIFCVIAMKTKENAFTLPLMIAFYELLFFNTSRSIDGVKTGRRMLYLIPFIITMLIIPFTYMTMITDSGELSAVLSGTTRLHIEHDRLDYLLTQFRVISTYIKLIFMPVHQGIYYDNMVYQSLAEPPVILSLIFLLSILCFGGYLLYWSRVRRNALVAPAFGIFWFFITLSVESSVIPIMDVINEYRVYLPSAGAFMAITSGAVLLAAGSRLAQKAAVWVAVMVVLALSGATYARNTVWQSEASLWEDAVRKAPNSSFGHYYLGKAYEGEGLTEKAIDAYKASIRLNPEAIWTHNKLAALYFINSMFDKAIVHYKLSLELDPEDVVGYINMGKAYMEKGLIKNADEQFRTALRVDPDNAALYSDIGNAYLQGGYVDKAIEHFETALRLNPENEAIAHNNLGAAYQSKGLFEKAVEHYRLAAELEPRNPASYFNLGTAYQSRGLLDNAIQLYQIVLKVAPDYSEAHSNLGVAYQSMGMTDKAIEHYRAALELNPKNALAHYNLGLIYFQKDFIEEAREEFKAALRIDPGYDKAWKSLERLNKRQ